MLLTEADGKALFRTAGIAIPLGVVVGAAAPVPALPGRGPWFVKAQVPVGGRGKAGGVIRCDDVAAVHGALDRLLGARIGGHEVHTCLVEAAVCSGHEYYLSLLLDPARYGVRVTLMREGGVDVERAAPAAAMRARLCAPERDEIAEAIRTLACNEPDAWRAALADTGGKLARLFLARELLLAEINPLFASAGS
jgi:succinyl-CoA synthetase beta subunit